MVKSEELVFAVVWVIGAVGFGAVLALLCNRFDRRCQRRAWRFALWSILVAFVLASAWTYAFKVRRCLPVSRSLCQELLFEWWCNNGLLLLVAILFVPRLCGWCGTAPVSAEIYRTLLPSVELRQ